MWPSGTSLEGFALSTNNRHPAARLPVDAPSSLEAGILADLHILETVLCGCRDPERQVALRDGKPWPPEKSHG